MTIENEKNTSYKEQLSKEVIFNFKNYIHTESGSFNYAELYNLRKYVVEKYVSEHIEKIQNDRNNLFSVINDQLKKFPGDENIKRKASHLRVKGEIAYENGMENLEETRGRLSSTLKSYTYYYKSFKESKKIVVEVEDDNKRT